MFGERSERSEKIRSCGVAGHGRNDDTTSLVQQIRFAVQKAVLYWDKRVSSSICLSSRAVADRRRALAFLPLPSSTRPENPGVACCWYTAKRIGAVKFLSKIMARTMSVKAPAKTASVQKITKAEVTKSDEMDPKADATS